MTVTDVRLLTVDEVGDRLRLTKQVVRRFFRRGELGFYRIGGVVRVSEDELARFLAERLVPARQVRRSTTPDEVVQLLDRHLPRQRGRTIKSAGDRADAS